MYAADTTTCQKTCSTPLTRVWKAWDWKPVLLDLCEDGYLSRWRAAMWQRQHTESPLLQPQVTHSEYTHFVHILHVVAIVTVSLCLLLSLCLSELSLSLSLSLSVCIQMERVAYLRPLPGGPPSLSQTLPVYLLCEGKEGSQGGTKDTQRMSEWQTGTGSHSGTVRQNVQLGRYAFVLWFDTSIWRFCFPS